MSNQPDNKSIRDIMLDLVGVQSDSGTVMERDAAERIASYLKRIRISVPTETAGELQIRAIISDGRLCGHLKKEPRRVRSFSPDTTTLWKLKVTAT